MKYLTLLLVSAAAHAGEQKSTVELIRPEARKFVLESDATFVGKADYSDNAGSGSLWSARVRLSTVQALPGISLLSGSGGKWQLRLGVDHQRHEFDHNSGSPLPDRLQRIAGIVALEYRVGKQVGVLIEAKPGVYFENDIRSNSFNCPVLFGVGIPVADNFTLALFARVDPLSKYPIIGGPGFIWRITDKVTLTAIPPEPRLTWSVNEDLNLWLGGEWATGTYHTDQRKGSSLSGAAVSFQDLRAGLGASWRRGAWTVEAAGGLSLDREWDYVQKDREFSTDETSPYIKLSARAEW